MNQEFIMDIYEASLKYMRLYIGFLNYQIIQKSRLHIEVLKHLWKIKSSFKNDLIKDRLFVNDFDFCRCS